MKRKHVQLAIKKSGLVLDPLYLFLSATLDELVSCNCCRNGGLEIYCPYSCNLVKGIEEDSCFCMKAKRVLIS